MPDPINLARPVAAVLGDLVAAKASLEARADALEAGAQPRALSVDDVVAASTQIMASQVAGFGAGIAAINAALQGA